MATKILTKYKPCKNPAEYTGFGYVFNDIDNTWYEDVAVFADDFSTDTSGDYTANQGSTLVTVESNKLKVESGAVGTQYATKNISGLTIGGRFKLLAEQTSGTSASRINFLGITDSSNMIDKEFIADSTNLTLYLYAEDGVGTFALYDYIAIIPLNDDGSIDFSNATPVTDGLGILGKAYIDADGEVERVEEVERETYSEVVSADKVKCNELDYTPVVYNGYSSSDVFSSGTIISFPDGATDNTNSMSNGIFITPEDGLYGIEFMMRSIHNSTTNTEVGAKVYVNGSDIEAYVSTRGISAGGVFTSNISTLSTVVQLKKTDTVYIAPYVTSASHYVASNSGLTIQKIGA